VGLELPSVMRELQKIPDFTTAGLVGHGMLLIVGMIILRMAWVTAGAYLPRVLSRRIRAREEKPPTPQVILLGWTGMRGVVSLAAALALEMNFPNRATIIFLTFFTILVTLVLQSLTLPMVVRLLGSQAVEDEEALECEARLHSARAALQFLKDVTESTDAFGEEGNELRAVYERRILRLETGPAPLPLSAVGIGTTLMDLRREVLSAERQAIVELRADQKITTEIYRRLMMDVDAEEMRMWGRG
jgi:monovalent cation/hydrogen antiporter